MQITIETFDDGCIVNYGGSIPEMYQFDQNDISDLHALLRTLADLLSPIECVGDKVRERISVRLEHGRNFNCRRKVCEVCGPC